MTGSAMPDQITEAREAWREASAEALRLKREATWETARIAAEMRETTTSRTYIEALEDDRAALEARLAEVERERDAAGGSIKNLAELAARRREERNLFAAALRAVVKRCGIRYDVGAYPTGAQPVCRGANEERAAILSIPEVQAAMTLIEGEK